MVNFGPLAAKICWRVWGTPANFNGFRVLAALLHGIPVLGISQTLRRWTEGATCIRQGGHYIGHWPTFLVFLCCVRFSFFSTMPRDWLGRMSLKWPILRRVGHKTVTQSINQPSNHLMVLIGLTHLTGHLDELCGRLGVHSFALQNLSTQQRCSCGKVRHSDIQHTRHPFNGLTTTW